MRGGGIRFEIPGGTPSLALPRGTGGGERKEGTRMAGEGLETVADDEFDEDWGGELVSFHVLVDGEFRVGVEHQGVEVDFEAWGEIDAFES